MPPQKRPAKLTRAERRAARDRATAHTSVADKIAAERSAEKIATRRGNAKAATERDSARTRPANERRQQTNDGRRTTVAIVGAGRLGSALALALDSYGYEVSALVSRSRSRARRAARTLTNSHPLALSAPELDRLPASDILIIATPDDQIEATAARLAASLDEDEKAADGRSVGNVEADARASSTAGRKFSRSALVTSRSSSHASSLPSPRRTPRVALHVSGALSSVALAPLRARGFAVGSLHPLVSVSDAQTALDNLRGAFYCVEGDAAATRLARRIVRSLGGRSFSIGARDKSLYHAAAVLAAGHAVALFDLATESLAACGLTRARARAVLLPLARSAVANLSASPTNAAALTGPFARADSETVRRNLSALARPGLGLASAAYALLGQASLDLAEQSGADLASLQEIARALSDADAD